MTHYKRFIIGLNLTGFGIILYYCGIQFVNIWMIYLSAVILGIGISWSFLSIIGYIKYFPPKFVSFFLSGLAFAGFFLSSIYLIALAFDFKLSDVKHFL